MGTHNDGWRSVRLRSSNVAMALVALVVVMALGSVLLRNVGPADSPMTQVSLNANEGLSKADPDAVGQAAVLLAGAPALDGFGDDALRVGEAETAASSRVDDALIVRTASLELEVADVATVLLTARDDIVALGGYVSGSDEFDQGDRRWASVTYRVPVARFNDAIDALRGLAARVVRESTQSTEVTATVVDLDARIANLRASEQALVEIMDRAGRIEDVLSVQSRLEDVRGQIERLEAQRANLADQAALSTLAVTWSTPMAAVAVAQEGWDLAQEVDAALAQTVQALQGVASLGVWIAVVVLPLLGLPLLVLAVLLVFLRRSRRGDQRVTTAP